MKCIGLLIIRNILFRINQDNWLQKTINLELVLFYMLAFDIFDVLFDN